MTGEPPLISTCALPPPALVADIVYVPLETPLLAAARQRGNPHRRRARHAAASGRPGFEAWFGAPVRVTPRTARGGDDDPAGHGDRT